MARENSRKILDLQFPQGGLNRKLAFQEQAPYTSVDMLNVRPTDCFGNRLRGGSRPGLGGTHRYASSVPTGRVNLLDTVDYTVQDGLKHAGDDFESLALSSTTWTAASWLSASLPDITDGLSQVSYNTTRGAIFRAISDLDTASEYRVDLLIQPYYGAHYGRYSIFAKMNDSSPVAITDGLVAELVLEAGGQYSGTLRTYNAGVATTYSFTGGGSSATPAKVGWFSVSVSSSTITVYWDNTEILTATAATFGGSAGARTGFAADCTIPGGVCLADAFRVQYTTTNKSQPLRRLLVTSADGTLYKETFYGQLTPVSSARTLASDRYLLSAERLQKLYIADHGNPVVNITNAVRGTGNTKVDSASIADWTAVSISAEDHVAVISSALLNSVNGTYEISSTASGEMTLSTAWTDASGGTSSLRIARCPKIYDPVANTLTRWVATTGKGQVPNECPIICQYRGRLVLAGAPYAPQAWYMCRQDDPLDWDYGADPGDSRRAVAGAVADAGAIGEAITAMAPYGDNKLYIGCTSSLWLMTGDPAYGGSAQNISREIGIVDKKAWCFGPTGEFVLLSRDGLYAANGESIISVSREKLPQELRDVDTKIYQVMLEYDVRDRGIHIILTPISESTGRLYFWFDWEKKGFFPWAPGAATLEPTAILSYSAPFSLDSCALFGCRDGKLRRHKDGNKGDETSSYTSRCKFGPFRAGVLSDILLHQVGLSLATGSGSSTIKTYVGNSAEASSRASAFGAGQTVSAGLNRRYRPRARGAGAILEITSTNQWAFERMECEIEHVGERRY